MPTPRTISTEILLLFDLNALAIGKTGGYCKADLIARFNNDLVIIGLLLRQLLVGTYPLFFFVERYTT